MDVKEKAEAAALRQPNRPMSKRFEVDEDAWLLLVKQGSRIPCRVVDLSLVGCRLRTRNVFWAGSLVRVEINFKVRGLAFRFGGVTQWTDGRYLVGVRFVDVIARRREELAEALGEIAEEIAVKAQVKASLEETAMEPAFEEKTGNEQTLEAPALWEEEKRASTRAVILEFPGQPRPAPQILPASPLKLAATTDSLLPKAELEQPVDPGVYFPNSDSVSARLSSDSTLALPGAEGSSSRPAGQPAGDPVRRDRRGQARYQFDTSVVIVLVHIPSRLQGRILDLSMDGCRIRTDKRFPVGIYTRVEIEFYMGGRPVRLAGVTQAIYDRHLVGIRFLDMSNRKREQLEQLIESIREERTADR